MRIGFTGTRKGMTASQKYEIEKWIFGRRDKITEFHHGACLGADSEFVMIVIDDGLWIDREIVAHPSDLDAWTSVFAVEHSDSTLQPRSPLQRNRDIVDACDLLLACPETTAEQLRSGTWATIRYAKKVGRPVVLFGPDGKVTESADKLLNGV